MADLKSIMEAELQLVNKLFEYIAIATACGFFTEDELRELVQLQQKFYTQIGVKGE